MNFILALMLLLDPANSPAPAAQAAPAAPAALAKGPQPIDKVLAAGIKPGADPVMVQTHILVHHVDMKKGMTVQFTDVKPSPNVHIKVWDKADQKLRELKPETMLKVTGQLHFGAVSGATQSIRYKVIDIKGKKYNDHQHWRTDKAIYIINPKYEIVEAK